MKNLTLIILFFLGSFSLHSQDFKTIVNGIVKGDLSSLVLDELVDFCFENDQDLLEPKEVKERITETISNIQPKSSKMVHIADSEEASKYAIAQLSTAQGQYRMFVYTEEGKIVEIRFNKE